MKPLKNCPECIYGNPCTMICINGQCGKPGFICANGISSKSECALFHDKCQKMQWSQLQNIINENPNTKLSEFHQLEEQMETLFSNLIKKVKDEHLNFRKWARFFGFPAETINFINMVNESNYNKFTGVYMNQVLSQLFMNEERHQQTSFSVEECQKVGKSLQSQLDRLKQLYMSQPKKQSFSMSTNVTLTPDGFNSKITQEVGYLKTLFVKSSVKKFTLLFRASENKFSADSFHKCCDNVTQTLTLIKTEYGKVIGGYTPLSWNSSEKHWAADKSIESFIFSVDMRQRFNLNLPQFAIACNPDKGPIFGCCDICIVDKSNTQKSNAQFPISYNNYKYTRNAETSLQFTGNVKGRFTTKEWQVFKVEYIE